MRDASTRDTNAVEIRGLRALLVVVRTGLVHHSRAGTGLHPVDAELLEQVAQLDDLCGGCPGTGLPTLASTVGP